MAKQLDFLRSDPEPAADPAKRKLLIRRQSIFYEEVSTNPAGRVIKLKKVSTTKGITFVVSVDGRRVDSFLTLGRAQRKAKALWHSEGALV